MLEEDRLRDDEYEKQYYGFSSTELYEDFKEQTSQAVKMALTEIETALEAAKYDKVLREQKIAEFYAAYMESAKIPLHKFKNEARKIFAIPKNVVLEEDQHKIEHFSDEDIIKLKTEVTELEKELLRNLPKSIEVDENHKKVMDFYEDHVQYYFSNENETETPHLKGIESDFIKTTDDYFK
ncbi:hypothetical protein NQ314_013276 [Rhamnusium bicolor]|uniref:Uncharacterized protein n=1 Tax=Rhamnusium bicolor TaxID=1586634 RepID=A0AAV8X6H0_9CUCU|nr:hypothetical protein NQ314_013276 [Rhamnusium bicolor]